MTTTCSTRIGSSIAAAGEPCTEVPSTSAPLPDEVVWGQKVKDRRIKTLTITLTPRNIRDVPRTKPEKQVVLRPEPMQNSHVKPLYQSKLVEGSNVVNRFALSPKQHIKLLAVPKRRPYCTHSHRPVLKNVKGCSPRLRQLSVPNRNNVLSTFCNFKDILPYDKMDKLYEILQHNPVMTVPDAETHFEDEEKTKDKKLIKQKRQERRRARRRQRILSRWIIRTTEKFASEFTEYLFGKTLLHQNHIERIISDRILETLKTHQKIAAVPHRKSHSVFQRSVLQVSDQAAHFVYNIVQFLDEKQIGWGDESTSTVTTQSITLPSNSSESICVLPEEIESIKSEISIHIIEKPEYEEEHFEPEELYIEIRKKPSKVELNTRMALLISILEHYYKMNGNDPSLKIFDSKLLPPMKFQELFETTQDLQKSEAITGPFEELVHEFRKKLVEYIEQVDPETLDSYMMIAINMVAHELAKAKYEEYMNLRYPKHVEKEEEEEEETVPAISIPSESLSINSDEIEDVYMKSEVPSEKVSLVSVKSSVKNEGQAEETVEEYIFTEKICKCPKLTVIPHSPTKVCCASIQAWASWTKDVADNARNWCFWIHQTISELRHMAAIVRGEVIESDGRKAVLRRDEWNAFVTKLDADVVRWRAYNQHVQSMTEDIMAHFRDKNIECCAKCLKEGYKDIHRLEAEHLCEQLMDALNTTQYWRKWLNGMVNEATILTNIIEVPDEISILDYSIGNDVTLIADAMVHIVATTQDEADSQSYYSIQRVSSREDPTKQ